MLEKLKQSAGEHKTTAEGGFSKLPLVTPDHIKIK